MAARLAAETNGEVISGDSRQVYRRMDVGTGKDYNDYYVDNKLIPFHLIDIAEPGEHYNVFRFQHDFIRVFTDITSRGKLPVLCGGSGLYLEAVLNDYQLIQVPPDLKLREELENKSLDELTTLLRGLKPTLHNTTDLENTRRAVRAIEIEKHYLHHPLEKSGMPELHSLNIGIRFDVLTRRKRITERLNKRLEEGMCDEIHKLLESGLQVADLLYYGLEYKYLTLFVTGKITWKEMTEKLETAIHQFAKRQMTWFRGMERRGIEIHWIEGELPTEQKIAAILSLFNN